MVEICEECKNTILSCTCNKRSLNQSISSDIKKINTLFEKDENGFYFCLCGEKLVNKQYFFYHLTECQKNIFNKNQQDLYECACDNAFYTQYEFMNHLHNNKMCLEDWKRQLIEFFH